MAYSYADDDCDSTFGEGFDLGHLMFFPLSMPVAGTKRDADNLLNDAPTTGSGLPVEREHRAEHIDHPAKCPTCHSHPDSTADARPSKRRASALKVGEYHALSDHSNLDHQFPTDCFEKFCQGCDTDTSCASPCALPCGDTDCSQEDVCWDPHCDQAQECHDSCVDPECSKVSCPDEPCFCQKCDAQPCPLGEPGNECHLAHSAPDTSGTIFCYDNVPCHFQSGLHNFAHPTLPAYNGYQCSSYGHGSLDQRHAAIHPSGTNTPILSPSNYASLGSTFSPQSSPDHGINLTANCFLNILDDHCHIGNTPCCHGSSRECGDFSTAPQDRFDFYKLSLGQEDDILGIANSYQTDGFGLHSGASNSYGYASMVDTTRQPSFELASSFHLDHPLISSNVSTIHTTPVLDQNSWLLPESHFLDNNKLDYLASAVQGGPVSPKASISLTDTSGFSTSPTTATLSESPPSCVCKWQHGPGMICLHIFDTPEALHKHIKTSHVDPCTHCFCQWEGCDASDKDFKQRSKLSRHLLGHAGHRPYACSFEGCSKTFATNQAKDNHERTHTGDRPYVCDHCGYTTTTHTQLQTHISALHLNQKPHKCRFCDFTCADSSNLSKHERTHQNLRPYRCPHPGCTFKPDCRWENLKRHLRRSNHCPELLMEGSDEIKAYREGVKRETEEWQKRNGDGGGVVVARKKGRA